MVPGNIPTKVKTYFESEGLLCWALYLPLDAFIFDPVALTDSALNEELINGDTILAT